MYRHYRILSAYPLVTNRVALGVRVPQFENPWLKSEVLLRLNTYITASEWGDGCSSRVSYWGRAWGSSPAAAGRGRGRLHRRGTARCRRESGSGCRYHTTRCTAATPSRTARRRQLTTEDWTQARTHRHTTQGQRHRHRDTTPTHGHTGTIYISLINTWNARHLKSIKGLLE